ncbi:MAG: diguanylate cyclase [Campylobacterales bacterium]|nr:diguanylate cyclase [Campylobacterales bacterium]
MITIFFIYGLSFFTFGGAILLYPKGLQDKRFVKHLWLIGIFGILHGIVEWIDMFKLIEPSNALLFNKINLLLLPLSYLFLLYFGLISLVDSFKRFLFSHLIFITAVLVTMLIALTFQNSNIYLAGNVWTRYLIAIPATFLTAYTLFKYKDNEGSHLYKKHLFLLSISFFAYGVLAGVIVSNASIGMASLLNTTAFQEYVGLPVQLFRALFAILMVLITISLLRKMRLEVESQLVQLSKAIEVSGDSVLITDKEGIVLYTNPAFEEQTGFTKKESYGKNASIVKSGRHSTPFYQNLWKTIRSGKTFRSYMVNKKKNGELYHEYKAIAAIKNHKGKITSFVSTGKDVTQHMLLEKKFEQLASIDKLTGIANRLKFDEVLHYSIDRAKRYKVALSVILFDIDDFKKVNDSYGHISGDHVLKEIAHIGNANIRKSDLLARWGGEEFMILQPDIPEDEASILAKRLRKAIENHTFGAVGKVTISLGVTNFLETDTADSFLKRVDEALYAAKTSGKNKVVIQ